MIKNRIKELRNVKSKDLVPNPKNWRTHPKKQQEALKSILGEIGFADAALARELPDGRLMLIDGHLRAETTPEEELPVLVLDVNEEEADKLLLTVDPLSEMAGTDVEALNDLRENAETASETLKELWSEQSGALTSEAVEPPKVKKLEVRTPPKMAWVLFGVPVVRFGEAQPHINALSKINNSTLLSTTNDTTYEKD